MFVGKYSLSVGKNYILTTIGARFSVFNVTPIEPYVQTLGFRGFK